MVLLIIALCIFIIILYFTKDKIKQIYNDYKYEQNNFDYDKEVLNSYNITQKNIKISTNDKNNTVDTSTYNFY